jgi:hypothetical protein
MKPLLYPNLTKWFWTKDSKEMSLNQSTQECAKRNAYRQKNEGMYVGEPKGMVRNVGMLSKTQRDKSAERKTSVKNEG